MIILYLLNIGEDKNLHSLVKKINCHKIYFNYSTNKKGYYFFEGSWSSHKKKDGWGVSRIMLTNY